MSDSNKDGTLVFSDEICTCINIVAVIIRRGKLQNKVLTIENGTISSGFPENRNGRQLELRLTAISPRENYTGTWCRKYATGKHSYAHSQKFINPGEFR